MPIPADVLTPLADVLAELYSDHASARAMAFMSGLKVQHIAMDAKTYNTWIEILNEAEVQGRTQLILDRARSDKPVYEPLRLACEAYATWVVAGRPGGIAAPGASARRDFTPKPYEPQTVLVPTGPFLMGSQRGSGIPDYETPQHTVVLPAYRIGTYPVSVRQYAAFIKQVKAQPVPQDAGWFNRQPPPDRLDHPVTHVNWYDAVAYCLWLSQQTGRPYRLPSEAEWEKAARGPDGRTYPWGATWEAANVHLGEGTTALFLPANDAVGGTVPARPGGASPYGCHDMLGHVQEWTCTQWGSQTGVPEYGYPYDPDDGREVIAAEQLPAQVRLVHRGGSFKSTPDELRGSARANYAPASAIAWRGFRVVMEINGEMNR